MGDLANMTSVHGEVDGFRLLRWLRSRAEMDRARQAEAYELKNDCSDVYHRGRAELLEAMADDLAAELTPPDYPEDDGDKRPWEEKMGLVPEPCPNCGGAVKYSELHGTGSCVKCGRVALDGDGVDLDDSATKDGP